MKDDKMQLPPRPVLGDLRWQVLTYCYEVDCARYWRDRMPYASHNPTLQGWYRQFAREWAKDARNRWHQRIMNV
jgi:hypothetical protein